jgi:hypothetical protein
LGCFRKRWLTLHTRCSYEREWRLSLCKSLLNPCRFSQSSRFISLCLRSRVSLHCATGTLSRTISNQILRHAKSLKSLEVQGRFQVIPASASKRVAEATLYSSARCRLFQEQLPLNGSFALPLQAKLVSNQSTCRLSSRETYFRWCEPKRAGQRPSPVALVEAISGQQFNKRCEFVAVDNQLGYTVGRVRQNCRLALLCPLRLLRLRPFAFFFPPGTFENLRSLRADAFLS